MINIFICMSAYHVLQALLIGRQGDAIVLSMNKLDQSLEAAVNNKFVGKVLVTPELDAYKKNKFIIPITFRYNLKKIIKFFHTCKVENIYVFNDVSPITQYLCCNINYTGVVIEVEEGIGLYRNSNIRQANLFKLFGKVCFGHSFEFITRQGTSSFVKYIMCHYPQLLNKQQKDKNIMEMPIGGFNDIATRMGIKQINGPDWFVGQPLVEDGVLREEDYLLIISRLIEFASRHNRMLVIKPHPRENIDKYKFFSSQLRIITNWKIPMELLIGNRFPTNVYTIYSSAVLQLSSIRNIQCYLLYKAIGIGNLELDAIFSKIDAIKVNSLEELL